METTKIRLSLEPSQLRPFNHVNDKDLSLEQLEEFGMSFDEKALRTLIATHGKDCGMDSSPDMHTTPSASTPIEFVRHWMPETIETLTVGQDIDKTLGRDMAGRFQDEAIVQQIVEFTGKAASYSDRGVGNFADYNINNEVRHIVRHRVDMEVGLLESMTSAEAKRNAAELKRRAVRRILETERNLIGYKGYYEGVNRTYGLLNDPNLPAYETVAAGASASTEWKNKTALEIQKDILSAISKLTEQCAGNFDSDTDKFVILVSQKVKDYLNKSNDYKLTVKAWLKENYPNAEIRSSAWLNNVNGNQNVMYVFANRLDGKKVMYNLVQDEVRLIGAVNLGAVSQEQYANACAGVMVVQPLGISRYTGI
ncbi:MAG: DUF2184 domain-containing protein [Elusimicrobiales bacterium]|nr:DUF2184 domain-containing protein [Elusimicrobiales bacterium]